MQRGARDAGPRLLTAWLVTLSPPVGATAQHRWTESAHAKRAGHGHAGPEGLASHPISALPDTWFTRWVHRLGGVHRPSVVRVGLNPHHSVAHVALDALIDHRMSANKDAPVRPELAI